MSEPTPPPVLLPATDPSVRAALSARIREFNDEVSPPHREIRPVGRDEFEIVVRGDDGELLAGVAASVYWGWLEIEDLWVASALRGRGIGGDLLSRVEAEGARRGAERAHLHTFSFQARGFYERRGYRTVGSLRDYPPGASFHWMGKEFGPEAMSPFDDEIRYRTTDLSLASPVDLAVLAEALAAHDVRTFAITHSSDELYYARFCTDEQYDEPEQTIDALLVAVEALDGPALEVWEHCEQREFDAGYDCGRRPGSFIQELSNPLLARIAATGATFCITLYPSESLN